MSNEFVKSPKVPSGGGTGKVWVSDSAGVGSWTTLTKVVNIGHTFAVGGAINVASGDTDFIPPFFIPIATNQVTQLIGCRYKINSGTSATVKLQKNGTDITGFTGISVATTTASTTPTAVTLATDDMLALVVTAISGAPKNLSFSLYLQHTAA